MLYPLLLLLVSSLCLPLASLASVVLEDTQRGALIRRHPVDQEGAARHGIQAQLNAAGELQPAAHLVPAPSPSLTALTDGVLGQRGMKRLKSQCYNAPSEADNVNFTFGTPNTTTCTYGCQISAPEDCKMAAHAISLNLRANVTIPSGDHADSFQIKNVPVNPPHLPNNCFMNATDNVVYYNAVPSPGPDYSGMWPICARERYPKGTNGSKATTRCDVDGSGDFEAIPSDDHIASATTDTEKEDMLLKAFEDCTKAHRISAGLSGCEAPAMEWRSRSSYDNKPPGCFIEHGANAEEQHEVNGCFNFNWKMAPSSATIVGNAVCQLKYPQNDVDYSTFR